MRNRAEEIAKVEGERNGIVIHTNVILVVAAAAVGWKYLDYLTKVKKK